MTVSMRCDPSKPILRAEAGRLQAEDMTGVDVIDFEMLRTDAWAALTAELDAWGEAGRPATFWWRDDDATRCGAQLSQLFAAAGAIPLALAVIPAGARDELARAVADHAAAGGRIAVLQHGYAHRNHAPPGEKNAEYGGHRPIAAMLGELAAGRAMLDSLFGEDFRPVLAPPWNRIAPPLAARLAEAGLAGLTGFGPRPAGSGATVTNTHVDIVDWRGSRGFVGDDVALGAAVSHLRARRAGLVDADEPTGLLTHHRDHDAACWQFVARVAAAVARHPAGRWVAWPAAGGEAP